MQILNNLNQMIIMKVTIVVIAALLTITLSQRILPWIAERFSGRHRLYVLASVAILRLLIIVVALWMIFSIIIEPTIENLFALLGALGLALGFAFKDYAGSLIAGIVTLYEIPYRLGDWVSVEGAYGEVKSIGMRSFEIITPDDTVVVIPHLKLWDKKIFNANDGSRNLQCTADFYLHPRHNPKAVIEALLDTAWTSSYLQVLKPVNVVASEKPWATQYRLKAYPVDPRDQFRFITDLTIRGKKALAELGVDFPALYDQPLDHF
ncbi:MAG: mechanosensitive ion channel [Desulfobacterales bacterium]|nr:mechanosensitive ion channel [Desulfobacterales bacterium]